MRQWRHPKTVSALGTTGTPVIDTSQSVFGGASGKFVGANSQYLSLADSPDWYLNTLDFTMDFRIRLATLPVAGVSSHVYMQRADSSGNQNFVKLLFDTPDSGVTYRFLFQCKLANVSVISFSKTTNPTIATNTWYHFAIVKSSGDYKMYQDGTKIGTTTTDTDPVPDIAGSLFIGLGDEFGNDYFLDGWLEEYRVSKGVARWQSNFTPPTQPYVPDQYTTLLLHMNGPNGSNVFNDSTYKYGKLALSQLVN